MNLIYKLALYLNKSKMKSSSDEITMYLYEHLEDVKTKSLRELSKDSFISQSSFSKYFKQHNMTYHQFQISIAENSAIWKNFKPKDNSEQHDNVLNDTVSKMISNIEMLKKIDMDHVVKLSKKITEFHRVIFIGSDFSMAIVNIIQTVLYGRGIICYTMYDPQGQQFMCSKAYENDLIIFISIKQRWYQEHKDVTNSLKQSKATKWLWTIEPNHIDKDIFDDVLLFGKNVNEFGYSQLMTFVPFFVDLI